MQRGCQVAASLLPNNGFLAHLQHVLNPITQLRPNAIGTEETLSYTDQLLARQIVEDCCHPLGFRPLAERKSQTIQPIADLVVGAGNEGAHAAAGAALRRQLWPSALIIPEGWHTMGLRADSSVRGRIHAERTPGYP
ncbi:hypothetical protein MPRG_60780 (plasmid) [Mycobacterium paragordonae]|uniref:Uncharacterized protein n=1 Tax=Mycobacterium paragordonae TaxID=1389713 RepID=A0ABQ1CEQ1_9MYCO|nr:hypothetical protein MPRG_60780 [Mycobacterium paragordonae]